MFNAKDYDNIMNKLLNSLIECLTDTIQPSGFFFFLGKSSDVIYVEKLYGEAKKALTANNHIDAFEKAIEIHSMLIKLGNTDINGTAAKKRAETLYEIIKKYHASQKDYAEKARDQIFSLDNKNKELEDSIKKKDESINEKEGNVETLKRKREEDEKELTKGKEKYKQKKSKIEELEAQSKDYQEKINKLEQEIFRLKGECTEKQAELEITEEKLRQAQKENLGHHGLDKGQQAAIGQAITYNDRLERFNAIFIPEIFRSRYQFQSMQPQDFDNILSVIRRNLGDLEKQISESIRPKKGHFFSYPQLTASSFDTSNDPRNLEIEGKGEVIHSEDNSESVKNSSSPLNLRWTGN